MFKFLIVFFLFFLSYSSIAEWTDLEEKLSNAIKNKNFEEAKRLIQAGADLGKKNQDGKTPFSYVDINNQTDAIEELLAAGAPQNAFEATRRIRNNPANAVLENNVRILNQAAHSNKGRLVNMLLRHFAKVDAPDKNNGTALYYASQKGNTDIAESLLKYGANPNIATDKGNTPLIEAVKQDNIELVTMLMLYDADQNLKDKSEKTTFDYAKNSKMKRLLKHLHDQQSRNPADPTRCMYKSEPVQILNQPLCGTQCVADVICKHPGVWCELSACPDTIVHRKVVCRGVSEKNNCPSASQCMNDKEYGLIQGFQSHVLVIEKYREHWENQYPFNSSSNQSRPRTQRSSGASGGIR